MIDGELPDRRPCWADGKSPPLGRRELFRLLAGTTAAVATVNWPKLAGTQEKRHSLAGEIGITTGGLNYQRENRILTVLTLPQFVRDELGMKLIDLNTRWLESYDERYLGRVRQAADDAGCFFTNLKVNHNFGDLYDHDINERGKAMSNARQLVDVAKLLGARWIRLSVPKVQASGEGAELVAHREVAAYAEGQGIQLLVENGGWMKSDPSSVARVVRAIGRNVAPCPDTGNWDDDIRYDALALTYPGAASCDFKVFELDAKGKHEKYDIRRCFELGWKAGFRGPWAIEHWNHDIKAFARETVYLRNLLRDWITVAG